MKTKSILAAILIITLSSFTFTANALCPSETKTLNKEKISEIVVSKISFTDDLAKQVENGVVLVSFFIENEHVVISGINASDNLLENYVKTQLTNIDVPNAKLTKEESINIKLVFRKN